MNAIPAFDPVWGAQLAEACAESYAAYGAAAPGALSQVDHVLAADHALDCALVTSALGAAPDDVRLWLKRAAYQFGEVFRLRGTTAAFPAVVVGPDGNRRATAPPGAVDSSLTNSRRALLAIYVALVAGDLALTEGIAALSGDPPEATYVGPDSEVCTSDEQRLAYALKSHLLGQDAVAVFHAADLGGAAPPVRLQAAALLALVDRDRVAFLDALRDLLRDHVAAARDARNAREPRRLLSVPGLGLAALAIRLGLVRIDQLPVDDVYLPLALLPAN